MEKSKNILLITGCTSKKLNHAAPAKYLYQGVLFKKLRRIVKQNNFDLKILSAKYGLLDSDVLIKPYDKIIKNEEDIIKLREMVLPKLKSIEDDYETIILVMGKKYRDVLKPMFENEKYKMIYDSRGIGGLTSKLNKYIKSPVRILFNDLILCKKS